MEDKPLNYFKYKNIVFYIFVCSVIFTILGLCLFRDIFYICTMTIIAYTLLKYIHMAFIMLFINFKYSKAMKSYKKRQEEKFTSDKEVTHVFIVPNYMEDLQILTQTIENLASHNRALNYCIFLAMEKHEEGAEQKAQILVKQFGKKFRILSYTTHELQPGQMKGKPSNINWCARYMTSKLLENYINMDTVIVTIMDSDTIFSEAYVDQVELHIENNYDKRHTYVYQPPQFFTRNEKQVNILVRLMDSLMCFMQCANLYSAFGFTIAVSNYSLSYKLLERIGFWDTCTFSLCEDLRTPAKAIWKTNGEVRTQPIYIPANQLSLKTGNGHYADIKARFKQAKTHCSHQVQFSYNLVNMMNSKINFVRKLHMFDTVAELYIMPICFPLPILILILQDLIPIIPRSGLDDGNSFAIFNNINLIVLITGFSLFQLLKSRASNSLFGIKPISFVYTIVCNLLLNIPLAILYGFLPMVYSSYNLFNDKVVYSVTPKSIKKRTNIQNPQSMFQPQQFEQSRLMAVQIAKAPREEAK